jgi:hypothetical protein
MYWSLKNLPKETMSQKNFYEILQNFTKFRKYSTTTFCRISQNFCETKIAFVVIYILQNKQKSISWPPYALHMYLLCIYTYYMLDHLNYCLYSWYNKRKEFWLKWIPTKKIGVIVSMNNAHPWAFINSTHCTKYCSSHNDRFIMNKTHKNTMW